MKTCHRAPRGWICTLEADHDGPCAAVPSWWNVSAAARSYRSRGRTR